MTWEEYNQLFHRAHVNEVAFKRVIDCDEELRKMVEMAVNEEREKVARWMVERGYATGHGDTIEDLLKELDWQIAENWTRAMINGVRGEREECAKVCEAGVVQTSDWDASYWNQACENRAAAIRARGELHEMLDRWLDGTWGDHD